MTTQIKKLALIFLFHLIALISYAQPGTKVKELHRKRHFLGNTPGHPYTTFDRHNGKTFEETIIEIRNRIKVDKNNQGPVFIAYKQVYDSAMKSRPTTDNGMPETGVSGLALWAKNNAFVMLVGLNDTGA